MLMSKALKANHVSHIHSQVLRGPAAILFISRDTCCDSIAKLFCACFLWGIAQLSRHTLQNGVSHRCACVKLSTKGGYRTVFGACSLKEYRAIWGIAAMVSQYRAIWGHIHSQVIIPPPGLLTASPRSSFHPQACSRHVAPTWYEQLGRFCRQWETGAEMTRTLSDDNSWILTAP